MRPKPDKRSVLLFYLLKKLNKCHCKHQLLQDGDRIAIGLSGGKDSGKLIVIRPLAYVPEKEVVRYAREADFPPHPPPCPSGNQSKRAIMREVLRLVEKSNPKVRIHLWRAIERCRLGADTERT
jgi:tRNA(Ile)-lysidine synthase TilS/MesJ